MKKILSVLVLLSFLSFLAVPMIVSAQTEPTECCKLGADIEWTSGKINGTDCSVATTPEVCKLEKGHTVGPTETGVICSQKNKAGTTGQTPDKKTNQWGVICILSGVYTATDWVFVGIMALVIIFILIGGFYILTAAGAPERVASGRQFIVWACIGLAVALGAKAIPAIVKALLGV